jgi:hypothetical protein
MVKNTVVITIIFFLYLIGLLCGNYLSHIYLSDKEDKSIDTYKPKCEERVKSVIEEGW